MADFQVFSANYFQILLALGGILTFGDARSIHLDLGCTTVDSQITSRSGRTDPNSRWEDFNVYMEESFTSAERGEMEDALETLQEVLPCVTFKLWPLDSIPSEDEHYVNVQRGRGGCSSWIGRVGRGQVMNLSPGCFNGRTVLHELLHALGVHHEQNRLDRDGYVTIFWENIEPGHEHNFGKVSGQDQDHSDFDVPYNYESIMHYSSGAFSRNGEPTILKKDGSKIRWSSTLQSTDILKLQSMYECGEEPMV